MLLLDAGVRNINYHRCGGIYQFIALGYCAGWN